MAAPARKRAASGSAGLHLVSSRAGREPESHWRSPLTLWHLLSLDAPSVAALWTVFAAWSAGVRLSLADPLAMFVAVWMLYAADRLLDARTLADGFPALDIEERHRFHSRFRRRFLPCLAAMAIPLAVLLHLLAAPVLHLYALLAALLAGWLLLVHARPEFFPATRRLPKEIAVGVFFPAAVLIPTVARAPALRLALLPGALLFAAVCTLNCLFLYAWEHPHDRSRAHLTTRFAVKFLLPLAWLGFSVALIVALLASLRLPVLTLASPHLAHTLAVPVACAGSIGLLLALHASRRSFPPLQLRALADVALLTPLAPLLLALLGAK